MTEKSHVYASKTKECIATHNKMCVTLYTPKKHKISLPSKLKD